MDQKIAPPLLWMSTSKNLPARNNLHNPTTPCAKENKLPAVYVLLQRLLMRPISVRKPPSPFLCEKSEARQGISKNGRQEPKICGEEAHLI